ncbi:ethanolamine utilization protein EutH [Aquibaculum arenosum]|uniref:Ethanolamine utilization protein EutH n=1 Tax=Aquibaculum arenosum TaxID=3032591 RepID=A0ABT5YHJ3_9PROT|nr:ethanolamine utilization protein EutH [Fodinicurvata sp. CAU 1616]MDF2094412.1 ethanolamine utilization protein EutH [Fodinicurvata sp. CAU 1616]
MEQIGTFVIYIIMACAVAGAIASIRDSESGLGKEFIEGLHSIGPIFIPVAGIMASIPYLSEFIRIVAGPIFAAIGADPAIAATTLIAVDMGGYQLADALAGSRDAWIMAAVVGYMAGATIIFSIPVGLAMLAKSDHKYMALGIMSGILSVPVGVFITCVLIALVGLNVRPDISASGAASYEMMLTIGDILRNLLPLIVFCVAIALGLRFAPDAMIAGFLWFGRIMYAGITLVLAFSIVEYFTGLFSTLFGGWGFDPIIADEEDQFRALEIAGYIGIMLAGAFPMVYLLTKYLARPMEAIGSRIGVSPEGAAGLLAAIANIIAMYRLIERMQPRDKVLAIAFAVCAAFAFGDHLAFAANFQPTIILPLLVGKLLGGACGFLLAVWLSVPKAEALAAEDAALAGKVQPQPAE